MNYKEAYEIIQTMKMIRYPKLVKVLPNQILANQIYNLYTNHNGELTTMTMYVYQHISITNKDLSKSLLEISKVEMTHLALLGELIKQLGCNPVYQNSKGENWCAGNLYYQTNDLKEMLKYDIISEKEAILSYKKLIRKHR